MSRDIISNHVEYSNEAVDEKAIGDGKLLFTRCRDKDCAALIKAGRLKALQVINHENTRIGGIYIAKVRKVVPNLKACFVEISGGEVCFLPFKEAAKIFRCSTVVNRKKNELCQGDEILVQIIREAQKNKQATVTAHISLTNEAAVISIGSNKVGYSSKLSKEEKNRFKTILTDKGYVENGIFKAPQDLIPEIKPYILETMKDTGMVVRTLAGEFSDEEFNQSVEKLFLEFTSLLATARHRICFSCIKPPVPAFAAVMDRLVYDYEYSEIVTDDAKLFSELEKYCSGRLTGKSIRLYNDESYSLEKLYSLETKIDEALSSRVWLKSGAYLVIEHTEALTVIDVNSGKCEPSGTTKSSDKDTDVKSSEYKINAEAAKEIALQLRLRNISGIIIVDFINMKSHSENEELIRTISSEVLADKQKCQFVDLTKLGLVELTRRKDYKPIYEQFT
jgi:ribonuclease G